MSINEYMKLSASMLYIGLIFFVLIAIVAVLFGIEKRLFKGLKKSLVSKYIILLIVIGYFLSVGLIYYKESKCYESYSTE